ncbi:MAG TPA: M1 family aminopeptidase [Thermoanaerobaculia bacterium]|nr:M1 family aminopeptidase [Thermoanaerobaculia bacterium]
MLRHILAFEVRYQLSQPLFFICTAIFFLLTFGAITTDSVQIGGAIGNVNRNAPFVVMQILLVMSTIGVFTTTAFVATSIHRDFEHGTWPLFFTTPIRKRDYLGGRFFGSFIVAFLVFVGVVAAIVIGSMMPWLEAERIGPLSAAPYIFSMLVLVLPNIFLTGAIFFALAALTRSMLATYVGVAGFFVAYAVSSAFLSDLDNRVLASMFDPFGFASFSLSTRYWTVFEKNNSILSLSGPLLYNRLLWMAIGAAVLGFCFHRFRFSSFGERAGGAKKKKRVVEEEATAAQTAAIVIPEAVRHFSRATSLHQYASQSRLELLGIVKSVAFLVLVFLAVLNHVGNSIGIEQIFGTATHPVTHLMLQVVQSAFVLYMLIILTFYSGELTWRERSVNLNEVYDALPTRTWIFWASKLTGLLAGLGILLGVAMLSSIVFQIVRGYHHFELALYLKGLFLELGFAFALIAVLALFFQAVSNHRYLGFLLMLLYFVSLFVLPAMDLEHNLYNYGGTPPSPYSDMNGYGHFVAPLFWFNLYWGFLAVILLSITHLFWVRGMQSTLRHRFATARRRFRGPVVAIVAAAAVGLVASGGWIYYNTNILNEYITSDERERRQAELEKKYKKYEGLPQPRITAVEVDVDIHPRELRAEARGHYLLKNKTDSPIRDLHVTVNPEAKIGSITIPGSRRTHEDAGGYYIYRLATPLAPGATLRVDFEMALSKKGFTNDTGSTKVVYNGTFFNNYDILPHFGYNRQLELIDRNKRRKHGLEPVQRMAKIDDPKGRLNTYISNESDWIDFETTVSTSEDQIALAPGYLQREWIEDGRRYFHYEMDAPILGFFAWLSADYQVKRDRWNGVAIEVYYDARHPWNVDRMIDGVKKSLDYFSTNFSPYQHRQVRIVEFPRYARFAQSFPNTIPFSESIGFIARLKNEEAIDYVFYVTAHEVAHQWWAHQVIGGDVQGSTLLSETLSQYSALMVMEKEYGQQKMRRFLKYELDTYLGGRGGELVEEMPLLLVENQPYIHYRKGSLVMYALRDAIGEDAVNRALASFLRRTAYQEPPYTTSRELLEHIRHETPPQWQPFVTDLFEKITLYDNRASEATVTTRPDGKYVVTLTVESKKFYATGGGDESEVPIDDWIDIGVLGETTTAGSRKKTEEILFLEKRRITEPRSVFEIIVDQKPVKAGIDPQNKLIDRNPADNVKSVTGG